MKRPLFYILLFGLFAATSCKKFLETELPKSRVVEEAVFKSDVIATSAIVGIYHQMRGSGFAGGSFSSTMMLAGLSADELINYNSNDMAYIEFNTNAITPTNASNLQLWASAYETVYATNAALAGLAAATGLTQPVKSRLQGEALFLRAFSYFHLVNFYGDVPLLLTTDYKINQSASRTPAVEVYAQIIKDLLEAQSLLPATYPGTEKTRVNKAAATALLARLYLYTGAWDKAVTQASLVINDSRYKLENDPAKVFLASSEEAVWQMPTPNLKGITAEGRTLILTSAPGTASPAALRPALVQSFDAADNRLMHWIDSFASGSSKFYYAAKYKNDGLQQVVTPELTTVIRLAELYLIRAEARTRQNQLPPAIADVDAIRQRAGIPLLSITQPAITKDELLLAIEQERKHELFLEWGHRWFDLKRTGRAGAVLKSIKSSWGDTDILYPIPEQELLLNPNLRPQNAGY